MEGAAHRECLGVRRRQWRSSRGLGASRRWLRAAVRAVEAGQRGARELEGARERERVSTMAQLVRCASAMRAGKARRQPGRAV